MIVLKEQLEVYLKQSSDIIPLHVWNKQTIDKKGKVVERGKSPLHMDWRNTPRSSTKQIDKWLKKGYNFGYRIGEEELIIDVDPRNFGDQQSLDDLCEFLGVEDLGNICPTVETGGGGFHYYLTMPKGVKLRETIEDFKGIEFKTQGRQVVAAGSKHPNGKHYEWDELTPGLDNRPEAPKRLIDLLRYVAPKNQASSGILNEDQLGKLLEQIPVDSYNDNDPWFKILCASHHATNGKGIDEFLAWSLDDMDYEDDEHLIRCRWESLNEKPVSITVNSLYKEVLKWGGETNVITAEEDFEDFADEVNLPESVKMVKALGEIQEDGEHSSLENHDKTDEETISISKALADKLQPNSHDDNKVQAIRSALHIKSKVAQLSLLEFIMKKLGINQGSFNKLVKAVKDDMESSIAQDLCRVLAELAYKLKFYNSKGLIYSIGEQLWRYNGTHWAVITKKYLERLVSDTLDELRKKVTVKRSENAIVIESSSILSRLCAVDYDKLNLCGKPRPIINCLNGELWIKKDGTTLLRKHRPDSNLLQVLDVEYDPGAECPLFEKMLAVTFSRFEDGDDLVEFVYEMIGYILQPNKDLEKWFLFYGTGGDGKSTLIRIISALLGKSVLPESVATFAKDNHIMSDVPGKLLIVDDDMDKGTKLPDGILKKLCGRNDLNGNPKGNKTERFTPATTVILSSNSLPRTDDLTEGGRRRPIVVPFNMSFHDIGGGGINDISEQIIKNELSGVLNIVLEGLKTLRDRGRFKEPRSCVLAKKKWVNCSNMNAMYVDDCLDITNNNEDKVYLGDMFANYKDWCIFNEIPRHSGKQHFRQYMEDLGLVFHENIKGNRKGFRGVRIKEVNNIEDFDETEDDF